MRMCLCTRTAVSTCCTQRGSFLAAQRSAPPPPCAPRLLPYQAPPDTPRTQALPTNVSATLVRPSSAIASATSCRGARSMHAGRRGSLKQSGALPQVVGLSCSCPKADALSSAPAWLGLAWLARCWLGQLRSGVCCTCLKPVPAAWRQRRPRLAGGCWRQTPASPGRSGWRTGRRPVGGWGGVGGCVVGAALPASSCVQASGR